MFVIFIQENSFKSIYVKSIFSLFLIISDFGKFLTYNPTVLQRNSLIHLQACFLFIMNFDFNDVIFYNWELMIMFDDFAVKSDSYIDCTDCQAIVAVSPTKLNYVRQHRHRNRNYKKREHDFAQTFALFRYDY